jgi:hypothetical protein
LSLEDCLRPVQKAKRLAQKIKEENPSAQPFRLGLRGILENQNRVDAIKANEEWVLMNLALLAIYADHFEEPTRKLSLPSGERA